MGGEALAQWLTTEINTNEAVITELLEVIAKLEARQIWEQAMKVMVLIINSR